MLVERRLSGVGGLRGVPGMAGWLLMTCAADGHEHWVGDSGRGGRQSGRYPALCGRLVISAALAAPPGPTCPACAAVATHGHRRQRSRRTGVLVQMIGLAGRSQGKHRRVGAR